MCRTNARSSVVVCGTGMTSSISPVTYGLSQVWCRLCAVWELSRAREKRQKTHKSVCAPHKLPSGGRILLSSGTHARALCSLRGRDIEAVRPHLRCDSALTPPGTLPPVASASLPAPWQRAPAGKQVRSYTSPVLMSSWPHGAQARATPTEAPFWGPIDALVDWCEPNYAVTRYVAEFWNTLSR